MNIITYFLLGAVIASVFAGKKLGNKAILWGGLCAIVPFIDVLFALGFDSASAEYVYGGITHSLTFCLLLSPILGWLLNRFVQQDLSVLRWSALAFVTMISHCVCDLFQLHGVALFEPFSSQRFALGIIAEHDLIVFTILLCTTLLVVFYPDSVVKQRIAAVGTFLFVAFVAFVAVNKQTVSIKFEAMLAEKNVRHSSVKLFPVTGSMFMWNCIAQDRDGFWLCYSSNLSKNNFDLNLLIRGDFYLFEFSKDESVQKLLQFTQGYYVAEQLPDRNGVLLHDLRYGRAGLKSHSEFLKTYKILHTDSEVQISNVGLSDLQILPLLWK